MASSRACISRIPLLRSSSLSSSLLFSSILPSLSSPISTSRRFIRLFASFSTQDLYTQHSTDQFPNLKTTKTGWKPLCLYYTQGKCTLMEESFHLDKFNHDCSVPLEEYMSKSEKLRSQNMDFFLVIDLEGKVEILEFPVMIIDAKTLHVVDFFHRFVRPTKMSEQRIKEYIEGKYGKIGVDRVWHDTAIPFTDVIQEFEAWISGHNLWERESGRSLTRAAFVTCGNWDIKTKIPQQCQVCGMQIPLYFMEWINLKDIYLNFYNRTAKGMRTMLDQLNIPLLGSHHLGIDDTKNIARVVQRMLADGVLMQITARRSPADPRSVDFLFENRIR